MSVSGMSAPKASFNSFNFLDTLISQAIQARCTATLLLGRNANAQIVKELIASLIQKHSPQPVKAFSTCHPHFSLATRRRTIHSGLSVKLNTAERAYK
jgi:hypothetical protein